MTKEIHASRPAMQRSELGPMMHVFTHDFFYEMDANAEDIVTDVFGAELKRAPRAIQTVESLMKMSGSIIDIYLAEAVNKAKTDQDYQIAQELIENHGILANSVNAEDGSKLVRLNYHKDFRSTVKEAIASGLVMPIQLWRTIDWRERGPVNFNYVISQEYMTKTVDASEVATRIIEPSFQMMLHILAFGRNGQLGEGSIEISSLRSLKLIEGFQNKLGFEFDSDNKVTDFSSSFKTNYRRIMQAHNSEARRLGEERGLSNDESESGGCPVRHSSYPKLGKYATKFLMALPPEKQRLLEAHETGITRSSRCVSDIMLILASLYMQHGFSATTDRKIRIEETVDSLGTRSYASPSGASV